MERAQTLMPASAPPVPLGLATTDPESQIWRVYKVCYLVRGNLLVSSKASCDEGPTPPGPVHHVVLAMTLLPPKPASHTRALCPSLSPGEQF